MKQNNIKTKTKKRTNYTFFYICFFIIGLLIFLYPFISMVLEKHNQTTVIANYVEDVKMASPIELQRNQKAIDDFNNDLNNDQLKTTGVSYANLLNLGNILGYIEIPKINVNLPIYQGTTEVVLKEGVGHIEKSSLPTSIDTAHVLLTGHTGLSTSKLFTDLNKIEKNDVFSITVLNKKYTYIVDNINVVLPTEAEKLKIENGENYATLITCTPYMINSHRLLVRGKFSKVEDVIKEDTVVDDKVITESGGLIESESIGSLVKAIGKEIEYVDMAMIAMFICETLFLAGINYMFIFLKKEVRDDEKLEEVKKEDLIEDIKEKDFEDNNIEEKDFEEDKIDEEEFDSKELDE